MCATLFYFSEVCFDTFSWLDLSKFSGISRRLRIVWRKSSRLLIRSTKQWLDSVTSKQVTLFEFLSHTPSFLLLSPILLNFLSVSLAHSAFTWSVWSSTPPLITWSSLLFLFLAVCVPKIHFFRFEQRTTEAAKLKIEVEKAQETINAAETLLGKLEGEHERWSKQVGSNLTTVRWLHEGNTFVCSSFGCQVMVILYEYIGEIAYLELKIEMVSFHWCYLSSVSFASVGLQPSYLLSALFRLTNALLLIFSPLECVRVWCVNVPLCIHVWCLHLHSMCLYPRRWATWARSWTTCPALLCSPRLSWLTWAARRRTCA